MGIISDDNLDEVNHASNGSSFSALSTFLVMKKYIIYLNNNYIVIIMLGGYIFSLQEQ